MLKVKKKVSSLIGFLLLFLLFGNVSASIYYIDASGNDSNSGISPLLAWKSIDKVNLAIKDGTISSGETVSFHKEDIFVGTLNTSGVYGISFNSYGEGENPVLSGLVKLNGTWTNVGGNIWRYNVLNLPTNHVRYLLLNGVNQKMAQSAARYSDDGGLNYFIDSDLGGSDGDYIGSEAVMRTTAYYWEVRKIVNYTASIGKVTYSSNTYGILKAGGGAVGGYLLQNSLRILQQNAKQNEWVNDGNYIYYYSITNPSLLGEIKVSSHDNLVIIKNSSNIKIENLKFEYANDYCILSGRSDYMNITSNYFDRCIFAIHDKDTKISKYSGYSSRYGFINNNTITNSGAGGIHQSYPINITITNNKIINTGLEIGKMLYIDDGLPYGAQTFSGGDAIFVSFDGGLVEYNNIISSGYMGIQAGYSKNKVLVQHNYVLNPCLTMVDCGAYYVYDEDQTINSNINKITFKDNLAVYDAYNNTDYLIGYDLPGTYGWLVHGFYKDAYFRAANYYDNFAFGFLEAYFSNPSMHSVWKENVGVNRYSATGERTFWFNDIGNVFWRNNTVENNTFISNSVGGSRIGLLYENQVSLESENSFDYNKMLEPLSSSSNIIYLIGSGTYVNLEQWKEKDAVGEHETGDIFDYFMSGLSNSSKFIWYAVNPTKVTAAVNFDPGYRYYDVEGDRILNDSLNSYKGKVYYRTIDEGMPKASNISIIGSFDIGTIQTGSYNYSHEEGNLESGSIYQWYRSYDGSLEARKLILSANSIIYNLTAEDKGQYIILGVKPKSTSGAGKLLTGVEQFSKPKFIDLIYHPADLNKNKILTSDEVGNYINNYFAGDGITLTEVIYSSTLFQSGGKYRYTGVSTGCISCPWNCYVID